MDFQKREITAVLFDLGDTLLNFGKVNKTAAIKQAARVSYEYLRELNQPVGSFLWYLLRNLIAIRIRYFWSNITKRDFDSLSLMRKLGKSHGFKLTDEQYEQLNWLWYKPLAEQAHIEPDLKKTFASLVERGLKLGIVSNTFVHGSALDRHLDMEGVLEYFPIRLYSCDYPYRKPDRRIFLDASSDIAESPENIVFVGDRLDTDVIGALGAGMVTVLKRSHANENKVAPEGVIRIDRISELPDLVDKIRI